MPDTGELKQVEEGRVFRVVGEDFRGEPYESEMPFSSLEVAKGSLAGWKRNGALNGRIQSRTDSNAPWKDVTDDDA